MFLNVPIIYEYAMVMKYALDDQDFFKTKITTLAGCMDEQVIKEALAVSKSRTFDQLLMHYIQVALSGAAIFFALLNILTQMIRRCIDHCEQVKEYHMELMSIKKGLDVVEADDTDESTSQRAQSMSKSASDFYKKSKRL